MEPLGRKSGDSFRSVSSSRHSYRGRSHKRRLQQEPIKTKTAEKVRKKIIINATAAFLPCVWSHLIIFLHAFNSFMFSSICASFSFISFLHCQHPSAMNESLSTCEHELVSRSLTIATLPLLVLTRRRSHSLTNDISEATRERRSVHNRLASHRSDSFDSLNLGKTPFKGFRSPQAVPRIIVISPTSESSLINRDSVCGEESVEALENNVFVSSTFSSEVFEAVELLS